MRPYENAYFQGNIIQLTTNQVNGNLKSSYGWVTYNKSVPLWDNSSHSLANFTTHFQFVIGRVNRFAGDGLTFFMAPFQSEPREGSAGGYLGLFNLTNDGNSSNQIVAVEFDTFRNLYDPDDNHVGIDVNTIVSAVNVSVSENSINRTTNETLKNGAYWDAWVDYSGGEKKLQVFLLYNPSGNSNNISKPGSPILSYDIDLREFLPENVKVGFSASTGQSEETHTIYNWNFSCEYSWQIVTPGNSPGKSSSNKSSVKVVLISLFACSAVVCGLLFVGRRWYFRKRDAPGEEVDETDMELDEWFAQGPRRFSYAELSAATKNFAEDEKLGQGGFGGVYRGILPGTNEAIAVKRISQGSKQGIKEYVSEVTIISKLRHRNLVQLLGWCHQKGKLLLVYEFLPNGSLDRFLYGAKDGYHLDWERRYSIACDIASALVYLHEDWDQRVVHRDVKASNVMLDSNFNAKLGDFGLARVVERDHAASHTTVVAGTFGYLAPECVITGRASPESDVYSFGALTLEIACGRRPVDVSLIEHNCRLLVWVWDLYAQGKVLDAADKILGGNFKADEMKRLMLVGLLCSHPDPKARPVMREVTKILKFESPVPYVPMNLPVAVYGDSLHGFDVTSMTSSSSVLSSCSSAPNAYGTSKPLLYHSQV